MSTLPPPTSPVRRLANHLAGGRRWVVLAMLIALHAALLSEPRSEFQRIWLLVRSGLFLLWQPFFAAEKELEVFAVVLLIVITAITIYFMPGWLIVAWLLVLLGILGRRRFYLGGGGPEPFFF